MAVHLVTLTSADLGLIPGTLEQLDHLAARFSREDLILRVTSVLHALGADLENHFRTVHESFLGSAPRDIQQLLGPRLQSGGVTLFEPLQLLLVLRRTFTVTPQQVVLDPTSDEGLRTFFDLCRIAADVLAVDLVRDPNDTDIDAWLKVGTGMMGRLSLVNPINPNHWIGRFRLMTERLPETRPDLRPHIDALKPRFADAVGLSFPDVVFLVQALSYWVLSPTTEQILSPDQGIRLNPETWLKDTRVPAEALRRFFERTARASSESLTDDELGGPLNPLPFRERPFIRFVSGIVGPVNREFVLEKLTSDLFWWLKDPTEPQESLWQADWGKLVEGYVLQVLARIAEESHCCIAVNRTFAGGEFDAAVWLGGDVALIEITTTTLNDSDGNSRDWRVVRSGLHRAFVERERNGRTEREVVAQLARNVRALAAGLLREHIPIDHINRVYPVAIFTERRLQAPGLWKYLDQQLHARLTDVGIPVAALATIHITDLENIDELVAQHRPSLRGSAPDLLNILRRWDTDRGVAPSWWQFMEWLTAPGIGPNRHLHAESLRWRDELPTLFNRDTQNDPKQPPNAQPGGPSGWKRAWLVLSVLWTVFFWFITMLTATDTLSTVSWGTIAVTSALWLLPILIMYPAFAVIRWVVRFRQRS